MISPYYVMCWTVNVTLPWWVSYCSLTIHDYPIKPTKEMLPCCGSICSDWPCMCRGRIKWYSLSPWPLNMSEIKASCSAPKQALYFVHGYWHFNLTLSFVCTVKTNICEAVGCHGNWSATLVRSSGTSHTSCRGPLAHWQITEMPSYNGELCLIDMTSMSCHRWAIPQISQHATVSML